MLKFFRAATYLLLLSLMLNVVEWPFADELLAEQTQPAQHMPPADGTQMSANLRTDAVRSTGHGTAKYSSASIYHTLMDLLDTATSLFFAAAEARQLFPTSIKQRFASRSLPSIDRPPALSLS